MASHGGTEILPSRTVKSWVARWICYPSQRASVIADRAIVRTVAVEKILEVLNGDRPHSLWVGAGVSRHLSSMGPHQVPMWSELVRDMEEHANIQPEDVKDFSFPERLEIIFRHSQRYNFQRLIREKIKDVMVKSALPAVRKFIRDGSVPTAFVDLSKLGYSANSIFNFNVESFTSAALSLSHGPVCVQSFVPPVLGATDPFYQTSFGGQSGQRKLVKQVIHPHGAIDLGGLCVLTSSDYRSMNGTLALQMAVHAAFGSDIIIVGMSLQDEYLLNQINEFRKYIGSIYLISNSSTGEYLKNSALKLDIKICVIENFESFWREIRCIDGLSDKQIYRAFCIFSHKIIELASQTDRGLNLYKFWEQSWRQGGEVDFDFFRIIDAHRLVELRNHGVDPKVRPLISLEEAQAMTIGLLEIWRDMAPSSQ